MQKPVVAIVGRPNVGKSTLFNRLAGNRISIVEGIPSITRDRLYTDVEWQGKSFVVVDTGGIEADENDLIKGKTRYQAEIAINEADLIIFVVDGRSGISTADQEVADLLRKAGKKVILVINKIDDFSNIEEIIWEFYSLGFEDMIPISAEHGKNIWRFTGIGA